MGNLFYGLNIAKNALNAHTAVLNITAHNIANANTPGYSRQSVLLTSIADESNRGLRMSGIMSIGSGVDAMEVQRSRFALYDEIYRQENQDLADYTKTEELMNQVEVLFDEPSDRGMSTIINDFFNAWQEAANDPQNMAARQSLKSFGEELAGRLNRTYSRLETMREDIDTEIMSIPQQINEISRAIADLNVSVRVAESQRAQSNDLRDKRDYLVDQLSEFVDVRTIEQKDGTYTVMVGSQVIVERDNQSDLTSHTRISEIDGIKKSFIYSSEGVEYESTRGKMGALIRFRDTHLANIMDKLNTFTEALVSSVNYEHKYGYGLDGSTGVNFFNPLKTNAFNIAVSDEISDVRKIAVSGDGSVGDNANAFRINAIRDNKAVDNTFSLSEYYNSMIAEIGIMAREAGTGRINEELLVTQIDNAREGIKGVSIDDELIQMIMTQRIYQSVSRIVVTLDELLQSILRI